MEVIPVFPVSEQQAFELEKKCKDIKEDIDLDIYKRIKAIVNRAQVNHMISDDEVNQLYELLNRAVRMKRDESCAEEKQNVWEGEIPKKNEVNEKDISDIQKKNVNYHMLLCNRANLRTIESLRRCIKHIETPKKRSFLSKEHF